MTEPSLGLAVVVDGMGGHPGGEVASAIAVTSIVRSLRAAGAASETVTGGAEAGFAAPTLWLERAMQRANRDILEGAQQHRRYRMMGCTAVAALVFDNRVGVAHVGDSRMYRCRGGDLEQLTTDHTVRQEMIDRGVYTPEEAALTVEGDVVTRALGSPGPLAVDLMEDQALPGDVLLLCSDGLSDLMEERSIESIVATGAPLGQIATALVDQANRNGGTDNVTAVLVRVRAPFPAH